MQASESLFDAGPLCRIQRRLGLIRSNDRCIRRRILLAVAIGWLPLAILTALSTSSTGERTSRFFAQDIAVHVRFLIATPLLIAAEAWCLPRLARILGHFLHSGIVADEDLETLDAELNSTRRMLRSNWGDALLLVVALASSFALASSVPPTLLPRWQVEPSASGHLWTAAGLWHLWVSLPLLMLLLLGWTWRHLLWSSLLWRIAKMRLRLIVAHPDRAGGLGFLGLALEGYWPMTFAFSAIVAGSLANELQKGYALNASRYVVVAAPVFVILVVLVPFMVFVPVLRRLRERAYFDYATLGLGIGREFEQVWVREHFTSDESVLSKPDFSAATDSSAVIGSTYQIRSFPIDRRFLFELMIVTSLPFVFLVLTTVPLDVILTDLSKVLF
jgi:hypothetical protein